MTNRAIVTLAVGEAFEELLQIALPSFHQFADRHGWDLIVADVPNTNRPPSWLKVPALVEALGTYQEVLWLDADTVIVDPTEDLEVSRCWQALVEHRTRDGDVPNCGVWYVTRPMRTILTAMWEEGRHVNHPWWEQGALVERMGYIGKPLRQMRPTLLAKQTVYLDQGWNVHRHDLTVAEHERIQHATMWPDRAALMRQWADNAAHHSVTATAV